MRLALKLVPLALLGCAAALLVACGDRSGLLSSSEAGSLQDALASAQSACSSGDEPGAELAAQRFSDRVAALPPGSVDPALVDNLQQGAATLAQLATETCTTETTTTPTVTTTTTPTTTAETTTTTTQPTTPVEPTTPTQPPVTPTAPPDNGGGTGPGNGGGTPGDGGAEPPGPPGNPGGASPDPSGGDD